MPYAVDLDRLVLAPPIGPIRTLAYAVVRVCVHAQEPVSGLGKGREKRTNLHSVSGRMTVPAWFSLLSFSFPPPPPVKLQQSLCVLLACRLPSRGKTQQFGRATKWKRYQQSIRLTRSYHSLCCCFLKITS